MKNFVIITFYLLIFVSFANLHRDRFEQKFTFPPRRASRRLVEKRRENGNSKKEIIYRGEIPENGGSF